MRQSVRTLLLIAVSQLCIALPAGAQISGERPDPDGVKTEVRISTYLLDIDSVDTVNQRFTVDLFTYFSWKDPRLALPEDQRHGATRVFPQDAIWTPRLLAANNRTLAPRLPRRATVTDDGTVSVEQRFYGSVAVDMRLQDFPFDEQLLTVDLLSYGHNTDELSLVYVADSSGFADSFSVEGWDFEMLPVANAPLFVASSGNEFPQLSLRIKAKRQTRYYLITMLLPMSLILFMAWSVFWLPASVVPSRVAVSTASIFSLIAFGFSVRLTLPQVAYVTRADMFVIGATVMVFFGLAVAIAGSRFALREREDMGRVLNRFMRWVYPLLYLALIGVAGWS